MIQTTFSSENPINISRKCILAVLPNKEKETLETWTESLSLQCRKSIRFVSIDSGKFIIKLPVVSSMAILRFV